MSPHGQGPGRPAGAAALGAERTIFEVGAEEAGQRLDRLVARWCRLTRVATRQSFAAGNVCIGPPGAPNALRRAGKGETAMLGARIVVARLPARAATTGARADHVAASALVVALETEHLVVVDKPAGQPSAPLRPDELGTLANALVARYPEMAAFGHRALEPGLCHRLDNDTSGLLLAARTPTAFTRLTAAIRTGRIAKSYLLVCPSSPLADQGTIDLPLGSERRGSARVVACVEGGAQPRGRARPALTRYRVLERRGSLALVEATASRALRHQIRAHFAAIGAPLCGDLLYGSTDGCGLGRHALHASRIEWPGDERLPAFRAESPLPVPLRRWLLG